MTEEQLRIIKEMDLIELTDEIEKGVKEPLTLPNFIAFCWGVRYALGKKPRVWNEKKGKWLYFATTKDPNNFLHYSDTPEGKKLVAGMLQKATREEVMAFISHPHFGNLSMRTDYASVKIIVKFSSFIDGTRI